MREGPLLFVPSDYTAVNPGIGAPVWHLAVWSIERASLIASRGCHTTLGSWQGKVNASQGVFAKSYVILYHPYMTGLAGPPRPLHWVVVALARALLDSHLLLGQAKAQQVAGSGSRVLPGRGGGQQGTARRSRRPNGGAAEQARGLLDGPDRKLRLRAPRAQARQRPLI